LFCQRDDITLYDDFPKRKLVSVYSFGRVNNKRKMAERKSPEIPVLSVAAKPTGTKPNISVKMFALNTR